MAVRESGVVANAERPGHSIGGAFVRRRKVAHEGKVAIGGDERRLNERLVHMLAAAPRHQRVETRSRFGACRHRHDDLGLLRRSRTRTRIRRAARACCEHAAERKRKRTGARELRELPPCQIPHVLVLPVIRQLHQHIKHPCRHRPSLRPLCPKVLQTQLM